MRAWSVQRQRTVSRWCGARRTRPSSTSCSLGRRNHRTPNALRGLLQRPEQPAREVGQEPIDQAGETGRIRSRRCADDPVLSRGAALVTAAPTGALLHHRPHRAHVESPPTTARCHSTSITFSRERSEIHADGPHRPRVHVARPTGRLLARWRHLDARVGRPRGASASSRVAS